MIDVSLGYVRKVLDQYLVSYLDAAPGIVVMDNLSGSDSPEPQKNRNRVVLTLVNLEYETNKQFSGGTRREGDRSIQVNPAVRFNLDILVSANFDDYGESLKFLSAVIGYFQENLAFTRSSNPEMPEGISALKFEIENSPSEKMHNLWTALGTSYVPSIVYKIRHVSMQSGQVKGSVPSVQDYTASSQP
ncbi:DUF4255 domain-containing protein [Massilia solisilvae]|uniref:DUF4255 domain-containing protein n=1 Tax=Massilia solisilvae TaxID=1811225 RepID=A0ABT2BP93_9BURK|nr:DUF4255 domain-containing protein [Massilia solisilvae]MCS0610331.1 DUF4255 domain-containing protein [Massilia solisilvae]